MKMSFNMDKKLAPSRSSKTIDLYAGFRLGRAAVSAEDFPQRKPFEDDDHFTKRLNSHLIAVAHQLQNEARRVLSVTRDEQTRRVQFVGTFTTMPVDDLYAALGAYVEFAEVGVVNWGDEFVGPRSGMLSEARMDRAVRLAAEYAHEQWNPLWETENRRRARKGGQTSKRGVSVPLEAVSACLEAVEHLPERRRATAIAELLTASGVKASARTVKRRLGELASVDGRNPGVRSTEEDERSAADELNVVAAAGDDAAHVGLGGGAFRDNDISRREGSRVIELDDFHEPKVAQPTDQDQPDVFDRFYAMFHEWQDDFQRRAQGEVDITAELESLLDELLPG